MAIKFTTTTSSYSCPICKKCLKIDVNDEYWNLIKFLLIIPALISWIINIIKDNSKKRTRSGEEIIKCPKCNTYVAISQTMMGTQSRQVLFENDILEIIEPSLNVIKQNGYIYKIIKQSEENYFNETLTLSFYKNNCEFKCKISIYYQGHLNTLMINNNEGKITIYSEMNLLTLVLS